MRWLLILLSLPLLVLAEEPPQEKHWWQKRHERPDYYYPHQPHFEVMEQGGDSCMLCHPFSPNSLLDIEQLGLLNVIANEPLAAICHECHKLELNAPWRCDLCHSDPATAWPENHNIDYINRHSEDARLDDGECRSCHLDLSFCSDCHFDRSNARRRVHRLGYLNQHGIDSRIDPAACGQCHNSFFCSDCHREAR